MVIDEQADGDLAMRTFAKRSGVRPAASAGSTILGRARVGQRHDANAIHCAPRADAAQRHTEANTAASEAETTAPSLDWNFGRIPVHAPAPARLQTKLELGTPGDIHEQEADRVAEQVMRMPEPKGRSKARGDISGHTTESAAQVQTKSTHAGDSGGVAAPPIVHEVLRSPGQPLDAATRAFMEPRFGRDFGHVRVHTDAKAADAARSINARAFAGSQHIVLGAGEHASGNNSGRTLLAHELVHTEQRSAGAIYRKIIVGGVTASAASLIPAVMSAVSTWYSGVVAGLTTQIPSFNATTDMPFNEVKAVARAGEILREMENAKYEKTTETWGSKKRSTSTGFAISDTEISRKPYDFDFNSPSDVINEVLFRLSLLLNTFQSDQENTAYARYPNKKETGFDLRDPTVWQSVPTNTMAQPGGFQLKPGTKPSAAITQLTSPVQNVQQRIVTDCSTMVGILYYKSLLQISNAATFDTSLSKMTVGPLNARYGAGAGSPHTLMKGGNKPGSPFMKEVTVSKLEDLVPGDTIMFANYGDYKKLNPGGLWSGEFGTYTKKEGKTLYFQGFGIQENAYDYFIDAMQAAYENAWKSANPNSRPALKKKEAADDTIGGERPGILKRIYRIDLAAYNE